MNQEHAMCVDLDDLGASWSENGYRRRLRYVADRETEMVLDSFDEHQIRSTFFVPGAVTKHSPGIITKIQSRGHDIASHGTTHCKIEKYRPSEFFEDIRRSKSELEDLSGGEVDTYKAPMWSITPRCPWAYDILLEAGFKIDHSIQPKMKKYLGESASRQRPFRYREQLLIIPPTTLHLLGVDLRFCGGAYNARIPGPLQKWAYGRLAATKIPFNYYFHPYEHSPVDHNLKWYKGGLRVSLYANHCGKYKHHIAYLSRHFQFVSLKRAYARFIHD
ncbi:MAG: polysaccharide deacetylase family protein [Pseudomonadota bacterium]